MNSILAIMGLVDNDTNQPKSDKPVVLLVEDDLLLVKMYQSKFSMEGFDFITAQDGEAGLAAILEKKPNFVILDVMMPKLSGLDVLAKMRANPTTSKIPVLMLTNLTQEAEAKRAVELGAKEYLIKAELTPKEVVEKVKEYLSS